MDDAKRSTLTVLVELAISADSSSCYDGGRAERLLRSQSSREELESIGVAPEILNQLFPTHERK